jgi:hypothetical protein
MQNQIKLCAVILMGFITVWSLAQPMGAMTQVKPPVTITLNAGKKPAPVTFDHKAHGERAEKSGKGCVECHHTSTNAKLKTEKPPKCATCHLEKANAKNPKVKGKEMWSQEAFHARCQECHKSGGKGPVKCMECHVKKA